MPLVKAGYNVLLPGQRVTPDVYYQEMRSSRICVSPFGYGELCWRDFEAVLCGCLLVKPDVSHLRTEPDIFIPGETYVPIRWDFSDLAEVCARYLADGEARNRIAARAYQVLSDYYRRSGFLDCFRKLLAQAGVAAATGEKAATLEEVNS
jgi:spore maturation protein CgeB